MPIRNTLLRPIGLRYNNHSGGITKYRETFTSSRSCSTEPPSFEVGKMSLFNTIERNHTMSKNRSNVARKSETEVEVVEVITTEVVAVETLAPPPESVIITTAVELIAKYGNKSNAIRALAAEGHKCGPISKALGIRYQHARNVLSQPLKRVIKDERDAANAAKAKEQEPAAQEA